MEHTKLARACPVSRPLEWESPEQAGRHQERRPQPALAEAGTALSQIPGQDDSQLLESVKIGDLSMRTEHEPVDHADQTFALQFFDGTPEGALGAARLPGYRSGLRKNSSVIGVKAEKPQDDLTLGAAKAQRPGETVPNIIELLNKQPRRQCPLRGWQTITYSRISFTNYDLSSTTYEGLMVCQALCNDAFRGIRG